MVRVARLRFRLSSLRRVGGAWTVDGEAPQGTAEALVVDEGVAGWLMAIRNIGIAEFDPRLRMPGFEADLTSGFYDVDVEDGQAARVLKVHPNVVRAASSSPGPAEGSWSGGRQPDEVMETGRRMRAFLESFVWPEWRRRHPSEEETMPPGSGIPEAHGMCSLSSACLLPLVEAAFPDGGWKIAGGHPSVAYRRERDQFLKAFEGLDGGMWDRLNGQWDGHYWLEGRHGGERIILDVTADQYGWDPVVVTGADDPRYRANYTAATLRKDLSGCFWEKWREFAVGAWAAAAECESPAPR